ncbi:helix-turn-helix transcriptional regulator [Ponticaulis sp.]|uniref:ArsR/SmtB family transcription factor n=1 Tax=Ponticaulis sp. TaxID=2020902 RepID=UPI000B6CA94F|nr:metalloregulator ArsR/SmtB family transcription factor [Ponticaulis sp.]MAI90706.1 transcriptional regulator [Ponticaulis sp.]OUX99211.1 MAG: hypothetical protein CBB65_09720 [Hyphomonadaceae bacterium TMED5]|tara:strand:- start:5720 stop:6079 length:360 start_codon:yes stop_codon:yes gene_type:complete
MKPLLEDLERSPDLSATLTGLNALAQEIRLKTFRLLMASGKDGMPAGMISSELDVAPNKLSAHLNILTQSGLIEVERQGRHMIYSANTDAVATLLNRLVETCCHNDPSLCEELSKVGKC